MSVREDWIATDLDGTLFSREWGRGNAIPATWKTSESAGADPIPSSWVPFATHRIYAAFGKIACIVPVTARDYTSFSRVSIREVPLNGFAVLSNGGIVLDASGNVDEEWHEMIKDRIGQWNNLLRDFCSWLKEVSSGVARTRVVEGAHGLAVYVGAKAPEEWWKSEQGLARLQECDYWKPLEVSLLKNELQAIPPFVGKQIAVEYLRDKHFAGRDPLLCIGDMDQDLPFIRLGHLMAAPRESPLGRSWAREFL